MRMRKLTAYLLLCILIVTSCTGCFGSREIGDWAFVYLLGVDKGETNNMRLTIYIPTMKGTSGGGGGGMSSSSQSEKDQFSLMTVDCPTIGAGMNMINSSLSRALNFMHAKYFIFGEEYAKSGVSKAINGMVRTRQIRRSMNVIIVKGKAEKFIHEFFPIIGSSLPKTMDDMMNQQNNTGMFDEVKYFDFINDMKSTYRQTTATLAAINDFSSIKKGDGEGKFKSSGDYTAGTLTRSGGNKTEFLGTALFNGDKMVGELNGDETRAMLMLRGEFNKGNFVIPDPIKPDVNITVEVRSKKKPKTKVDFIDGAPVINEKIYLEGDLMNLQSDVEFESRQLKPVLEEAYKKQFQKDINKTIEKCRELNVDCFAFGEWVVRKFAYIKEWEDYKWLSKFKDAKVNIEVDFSIKRTGSMTKTSDTVEAEENK